MQMSAMQMSVMQMKPVGVQEGWRVKDFLEKKSWSKTLDFSRSH